MSFKRWMDNAFWENDDKSQLNCILEMEDDVGRMTRQVMLLNRTDKEGNPNPDFVYGLNLNFRYKRLNASFLFNGVHGNDIANGNLLTIGNAGGQFQNITSDAYYNAWRADAPSNTQPRIGYNTIGDTAITDRIIEDGSFLRLNNVTIGFDYPLENSKLMERLNFYVTAQNLFVWTDYSGYNPEISSFLYDGLRNGVDWNGSPDAKNISFGVNVNF
jgi:hypothetical protein